MQGAYRGGRVDAGAASTAPSWPLFGLRSLALSLSFALAAGTARADPGDVELPPETPTETDEAAKRREGGWVVLPGVFYSPDTGLSGSGAVLRYVRVRGNQRPSKIKATAALSLRGAGEVDVDPDLWLLGDQLNLQLTSKVSYLERAFFGIGNDAPESARENYTSWRVDARLELARRLPHDLYLAPIYDFRWQDVIEVEPGGMLAEGAVPGADGGFLSALGIELRWDTRDSVFYPTRGVKLETSPRLYHRVFGSDHDFVRFFFDASTYLEIAPGHVLGLDGRADFRWGEPPFDHLSVAGGNRLLRGMLRGRFRDDHYLGGQVEYRFPVYWRFGAVAFAGLGRVASDLGDFDLRGWKASAGGGLRFAVDVEERINIRVDYGVTGHGTGVYLNVLEAF